MDLLLERDCTFKCRSAAHANQIFGCVASATSSQIRSYSAWLCHNFSVVTDEFGRNLLHIASACGKWDIVEWLLANCNVEVDIKDLESGWTALHRSIFYGQLTSARILSMHGANMRVIDHEGFTPLDIAMKDRLPYIEYLPTDPSEVYAWGSNFNYNLGFGNLQSHKDPEVVEVLRKTSQSIKQVVICKFHSVFLSSNGKVYTCGYGHGGRLGQGSEDSSLVPSLVKGINLHFCEQVAAGQDHMLLLLEGGQVWSCGLNTYHQLGLNPPVERCLVPKPLPLKFLKGKEVIGIHAARFHSVIYTKDCVFTFGLNAGQLGHPKADRTQIHPRQVSALFNEDWHITHVETSDGAIVCATSRGDVYVLHEYQIRKIASRQLEISKLSVVGGHLDSRCDVAGVREGGGLELRVVLLTKSGKVFLWRQTDPYIRRCLFQLQKELIISDIHINHYSIGLITSNNEGYMGSIMPFKGQRSAPPAATLHAPTIFSTRPTHGLNMLLDTNDCNFIKVKKLPNIYRGTSITSDSKGRNFSVLQSSPKMGLIELPMVSESVMIKDFAKLFSETYVGDDFHDFIIKVGKREFAAHKYILGSRSDFFRKHLISEIGKSDQLVIDNIRPEAFEQVLKFIYCNNCDFLTPGYEVKWEIQQENGKKKKSGSKASKSVNPVVVVQEASKRFHTHALTKRLENIKIISGMITLSDQSSLSPVVFDRLSLSNLSDVTLLSADGMAFHCHKCVLVARLDYFHSMLSTFWAERSHLEQLSLPISSQVMEVILEYIYSDKSNRVLDSDDAEFLCHVLITTDQLLIPRLKEICEMSLVELITLKNAAELLEFSCVSNSLQLKRTCMEFISINLAAVMETKTLGILSVDVMEDLCSYYRSLIPSMHSRKIAYFGPSQDILAFVEEKYPISNTQIFEKAKLDLHDSKTRGKRRLNSGHTEVKDISSSNRNKSNSESSEKDIILDIQQFSEPELKVISKSQAKTEFKIVPMKEEVKISKTPDKLDNKPGTWIMKCPSQAQMLESIMMEEQQKLTTLPKKSNMKPMPHLSQKKKKMLETTSENPADLLITSSPTLSTPKKKSCPWAKLPEQSPPSPSFWDTLEKKEFQASHITNESISSDKFVTDFCGRNHTPNNSMYGSSLENLQDIVISLTDIQKAEEQKLRRAVNPKIKPLNIINIEDQAIEALIELYHAKDNLKEKVTVSRVMPKEIASPVWKKHGH